MTIWTDHDVCDAIAAGRPVASDRALANAEYFALVENGQLTEKGWALIRGTRIAGYWRGPRKGRGKGKKNRD